jgi:flagellar basal body rod protein FlgG
MKNGGACMDFRMATEGMMAMEHKQAVIANNLANVGTAGYRREIMDVSFVLQKCLTSRLALLPAVPAVVMS